MTPLDLSIAPPRGPRDVLDGLIFLPRTIDKVRATLPGGDLGAYQIAGLTQAQLDALGIPLDAFTAAVAAAVDDAEIAAFVRARATADACERWNERIAKWLPRAGNRAQAVEVYPWLAARPDIILVLDVLEEDDRLHFAALRG